MKMTLSSAAAVIAAAALTPSLAMAQTASTGTSTGVTGRDVSVGTYGSGQTTTSPDGSSLGVSGGGYATAGNGGSATTDSQAKLNERRAMQRSVATAQDDDERARSRTRTVVRNGETVRSRSHTFYKADGERPVHERSYSVSGTNGGSSSQPAPK
jgi:hypothetical protein